MTVSSTGSSPGSSPGSSTGLSCGVDVGGTKILGLAVDASGGVVRGPVRADTPSDGVALIEAIVGVIEAVGVGVDTIGVGVPGLVDRAGVLTFGPNLPGIVDLPVRDRLVARFAGVPVTVDNDATGAVWAELQLGAARGARDVVLVTLGTGIGGGYVTGGELQRGTHGFAGEPGHMVVDPGGPPCSCGGRGCWERYASGSGLGRFAREAAESGRGRRLVELAGGNPELVRGEHVTAAAREGDVEAVDVFRQVGWWAALGIANLVNVLDPEVVVVGGGLAAAGPLLLDPIRAAYPALVLGGPRRPPVRIEAAQLGEHAGAVGAALLSRRGTTVEPWT